MFSLLYFYTWLYLSLSVSIMFPVQPFSFLGSFMVKVVTLFTVLLRTNLRNIWWYLIQLRLLMGLFILILLWICFSHFVSLRQDNDRCVETRGSLRWAFAQVQEHNRSEWPGQRHYYLVWNKYYFRSLWTQYKISNTFNLIHYINIIFNTDIISTH